MKKIISMMLVLVLVLSLCACGGSKTETAEGEQTAVSGLQMGYAWEKIMPETSVPLSGYGNTSQRFSENFLDYLYTTCIAAKEGDTTVLFYTIDMILPNDAWVKEVRQRIEGELGIPMDHVTMSFTHTHSAPDMFSSEPVIKQYRTLWVEACVKAAKNAVADLAPAVLYGTKTKTEGMNFVRHYLLQDGTYGGDNFGNFNQTIISHAEENDPGMVLLKADREGDKQDILIVNWQAHPCKTGGGTKTDISADFPGAVRDAVTAQTGMLCAYFTGAAGNQNTSSRITGEDKEMDKIQFGEALAKIAIDALPNLEAIGGTGIQTSQVMFEYAYNHDDEHMLLDAQKVSEFWKTATNAEAATFARSLGFSSQYHANAVIARVKRAASGTMEMDAIRIGNFAFVTAPYEMFAAHGMYIKDNSPFEYTMVFECSNQYQSYIPTAMAYDYGCYESYTSIFAKGAGEAAAEKYVEMLKGLQ